MGFHQLPHGVPVLESVAAGLLRATGADPVALSRTLVFLPTRRAARALAAAFLREAAGAPLLLPRLVAIADIDSNPLFAADTAGLAPAVAPLVRQAMLAAMITRGFPEISPDRAVELAADLALLLDEAAEAEVELAELGRLAPERFARHWQKTLRFLAIATEGWRNVLEEKGLCDPVRRRVGVLRALAARLCRDQPDFPVLAVGITTPAPATVALLCAIAGCPHGAVLVAGLDPELPDAAWQAVGPTHPAFQQKALLDRLGLARGDLAPWPHHPPPHAAGRRALLASALLPAAALDWATPLPAGAGAGCELLVAPDSQAEARAIALCVREALEAPDTRIAVITPDRLLAERVAAALARWGVFVEDSAALPLSRTAPGTLLRLLAAALARNLAPVPLLSLLRHPLVAGGMAPERFRAAGRNFELGALRGPRPDPGRLFTPEALGGPWRDDALARALQSAVGPILAPLQALFAQPTAPAARLLRETVTTAEALAATDARAGGERLWSGPEGAALARHIAAIAEALELLPPIAPRWWPDLLDRLLAQASVRARRALAGREDAAHPRVEILGVLEARLLAYDVVVLAGLNEGTWPALPDPGPWLSRPQRMELGLASPDAAVGTAAADFLAAAMAPRVILARAAKVDGEPTVPSRWLTRILARAGEEALRPATDHVALAARLDVPAKRTPEPQPAPLPPLAVRPRRLPVTRIERLRDNPYAVYAEQILRLRPLEPLDQEADAADWGSLVHDVAKDFVVEWMQARPADAEAAFLRHARRHLEARTARPGLVALWRPRLATLAPWFARHLVETPAAARLTEVSGTMEFAGPAGIFTLTARADRIDIGADGGLTLYDYKTGKPPSGRAVREAAALQLPLSGLIADADGFPGTSGGRIEALAYVQLSGGPDPVKLQPVGDRATVGGAMAEARAVLLDLIRRYDSPAEPYRARAVNDDFAHLARSAAWAAAREEAEE